MELRDLEAFGEPGAIVYLADCVELMRLMPAGSVDAVFADPPYRLSNGGVTVKNGRLESVDKGAWDRSLGSFERDHAFNVCWLEGVRRVLKADGTIWVSGTHHVIFSIGFALQTSGFRIINSVVWEKPDPPPNALHTAFTHPKAVVRRVRFRLHRARVEEVGVPTTLLARDSAGFRSRAAARGCRPSATTAPGPRSPVSARTGRSRAPPGAARPAR